MFCHSNFHLIEGKHHSKAFHKGSLGEARPRTLKGIPVPSTGACTPTTLFSKTFLPAHAPTIVKSDPGGSSKGITHEVLHSHVCGNKNHNLSYPEWGGLGQGHAPTSVQVGPTGWDSAIQAWRTDRDLWTDDSRNSNNLCLQSWAKAKKLTNAHSPTIMLPYSYVLWHWMPDKVSQKQK